MSKIVKYEMKPVTIKRVKLRTSKSIFDPILDEFLRGDEKLVEITVEGRTTSSLKSALMKRLEKREEPDVEVTLGYGVVYLEKITPPS